MSELQDTLRQLAVTRAALELVRSVRDMRFKQLEVLNEWITYQNEVNNIRGLEAQESELADRVRSLAVKEFDGENKRFAPGIQIKEYSTVLIKDEKRALQWASQNAPSILKLDQAKFKKAVENLELDFVEKAVEYKAQVDSDLSFMLMDDVMDEEERNEGHPGHPGEYGDN